MRTKVRPRVYRRWWFWAAVGVVAVLVFCAVWLGTRVLQAKTELETAQTLIGDLSTQAAALDLDGAVAKFDTISDHTDRAVELSNDPIWRAAEVVPWLGVNLSAVRELSGAVQLVLDDVAGPLIEVVGGLDPASLAPKDGAIDHQPFVDAVPAVVSADEGLQRAIPAVASINTNGAMGQIVAARDKVAGMLDQIEPLMKTAKELVLAPALGSEAPRNYVVMFQNNAESRPLGGTALSFAVVNVDKGRIQLTETVPAGLSNFLRTQESIVPVPGGVQELYGGGFGTFIANTTVRPSFTSAAEITQAMWIRDRGYAPDGIVSIDPVTLSYVLRATDPITLSSGDVLSSDTIVPLLLNEVYQRFNSGNLVVDNARQDAVYGEAVAATFATLTSGSLDPALLIGAIMQGWSEHRVLLWSANPDEQAQLSTLISNGELPVSDETIDRVGVYFTDNVGSKLNYYMKQAVTLSQATCRSDELSNYRVGIELRSTLDRGAGSALSPSITGQWKAEGLKPGQQRMQVFLYAPPGSTIAGATFNGLPIGLDPHHDTDYPVAKVTLLVEPGATVHLDLDVVAAEAGNKKLEALVTPMVNPTKVTTGELDCATVAVG